MILPHKVRVGQEVSAADFNKLIDAIRSSMIMPGVGYRIAQSAVGVSLSIDKESQDFTGAHPWMVTSNGDDTVASASGIVGWWVKTATGFYHNYHKFSAVGSITVTGTGFIIATYTSTTDGRSEAYLADETLTLYADGQYSSGETVKFSTDPSAETADIVIVLAEVSLASSVAVVDEQIVTHNNITEIVADFEVN